MKIFLIMNFIKFSENSDKTSWSATTKACRSWNECPSFFIFILLSYAILLAIFWEKKDSVNVSFLISVCLFRVMVKRQSFYVPNISFSKRSDKINFNYYLESKIHRKRVNVIKNLGVIFDSKLTFIDQYILDELPVFDSIANQLKGIFNEY